MLNNNDDGDDDGGDFRSVVDGDRRDDDEDDEDNVAFFAAAPARDAANMALEGDALNDASRAFFSTGVTSTASIISQEWLALARNRTLTGIKRFRTTPPRGVEKFHATIARAIRDAVEVPSFGTFELNKLDKKTEEMLYNTAAILTPINSLLMLADALRDADPDDLAVGALNDCARALLAHELESISFRRFSLAAAHGLERDTLAVTAPTALVNDRAALAALERAKKIAAAARPAPPRRAPPPRARQPALLPNAPTRFATQYHQQQPQQQQHQQQQQQQPPYQPQHQQQAPAQRGGAGRGRGRARGRRGNFHGH